MEVTVKYTIKNFIDEYSFVNEFNGDAVKCYEMVSDNYSDSIHNFTDSIHNFTDDYEIIKIEKKNE